MSCLITLMQQQTSSSNSRLAGANFGGIADRTDFDLKRHMEHSGEDFNYVDPATNERYVPYCIEPSLGADRVTLAFFLCDAYEEEQLEK
ncbi:hypothetical protein GCM10020331_029350 [Ectobacillus funiculus]